MPRRKRIYLPGMSYHLVQRGNNREACFRAPEDFQNYLDLWREKSRRYEVAVHAYCLMNNHVHFVVSCADSTAISNTMKDVGSRYARHFNVCYERTGTLWEGRHRSSLIDTDNYLLTCYRYVELNPVRAGIVASPALYAWSSYRCNAWGDASWLTPHPVYDALGGDDVHRRVSYRALFEQTFERGALDLIRVAAHYSQPVGDENFRRTLSTRFNIAFGYLAHGRPRRPAP